MLSSRPIRLRRRSGLSGGPAPRQAAPWGAGRDRRPPHIDGCALKDRSRQFVQERRAVHRVRGRHRPRGASDRVPSRSCPTAPASRSRAAAQASSGEFRQHLQGVDLEDALRAGPGPLDQRLKQVVDGGGARAIAFGNFAAARRPPSSLLPPSGGRSGGGSRPWGRRRPAGLARSANEGAGLRPARPAGRRRTQARCFFMDERDREDPCPGRRAPGSTPLPTSPRAIALGIFAAARRHHYRRAGVRGRRFLSSPLQGGGREGGPAPGCAGVPPASRVARTRMRAFGPPSRRDVGAPRQFTDERDRESPRPGRPAPGSTPLPTSPLPGGRREDGAARLPVRPSRVFPNDTPDSSPLEGRKSEDGVSSAIALGAGPSCISVIACYLQAPNQPRPRRPPAPGFLFHAPPSPASLASGGVITPPNFGTRAKLTVHCIRFTASQSACVTPTRSAAARS